MQCILELKVPRLQEQTVLLGLPTIKGMSQKPPEDTNIDEKDQLLVGFSQRLREVLADQKMPDTWETYKALGRRFELGPKGVEKWFKAKSWPRNHVMVAFSEWAGVTIDWLMTGKKPKFRHVDYASENISRVAGMMKSMPPEQQYLAARLVDQVAQPPHVPTNDSETTGTTGR